MVQSPGSVQNEVRDTSQGTAFISAIDGGLLSLAMIAGYYRIACDPAQMAHDLGLGHRASNAEDIVRAARRLGLKARALPDQTPKRLRSAPLPGILQMRDGSFVILTHRLDDGRLRIIRPLTRAQSFETLEDVTQAWSGELVLITRRLGGPGADPITFDFSWFLPSIWRYRKPISHFLLASLFVQLFALVTPLFFQVVVDKVLVHNGGSTLSVIVVGLVALNHTTSRIDVELGARLFDHLLRLPLAYFETRATGQAILPPWPTLMSSCAPPTPTAMRSSAILRQVTTYRCRLTKLKSAA